MLYTTGIKEASASELINEAVYLINEALHKMDNTETVLWMDLFARKNSIKNLAEKQKKEEEKKNQ